jgi:hypothetical protein
MTREQNKNKIVAALSQAEGRAMGEGSAAVIFPIVLPYVVAAQAGVQSVEDRDRTIRSL